MENIEKIVAMKIEKVYPENEVGMLRKVGESDGGLLASFTPKREIEFISEDDFESPCRENFENFIIKVNEGQYDEEGTKFQFLTNLEVNK